MNTPPLSLADFARQAPSACRYSLREMAHLTGLTRPTARQWLRRYVPPCAEKGFSFENLIELHVLTGLHRAYKPPAADVAETLARLPQARPLLSFNALHATAGMLANERNSTGRTDLFRAWLDRIEWHSDHAAPKRLYPLYHATVETADDVRRAAKLVAVDPQVRFGSAFLVNSGIPVAALVGQYRGGDSVRAIAEDFQIAVTEVEEAIRYELVLVG